MHWELDCFGVLDSAIEGRIKWFATHGSIFKKEGLVKESICNRRTWLASAGVVVALLLATSVSHADVFYVADEARLVKISANGVPSVFIQEPDRGFQDPTSVAIDDTGNLYLTSINSNDVKKLTPNGDLSVFIHTPVLAWGVATDRFNNIYLAEALGNTILKVSPGGVPTVLTDQVYRPGSIAVDFSGNVYSSNWDNTVSKITSGGTVTTLASGINGATGIALNGDGNVYLGDFGDKSILKIAPDGTVSTFASGLDSPAGLVFDSNGDLYVSNRNTVSKVTSNGVVTPFASGLLHARGGIVAQVVPEPSSMMVFGALGIGFLSRGR